MIDAIAIVVCVAALIALATWLLSWSYTAKRSSWCVCVRHTKPRGLEIVYQSRSVGPCRRYVNRYRTLGISYVIVARHDVDAENIEAISHPQFWRDISDLTAGTPEKVARYARDIEVLADRIATVGRSLYRAVDTEPLTNVDGIPLGGHNG